MAAPRVTVESPLPWLQITPSSDPQFTSKVNSAIGTAIANQIAYVLPYSVVITNSGDTPITAIGMLFEVTQPGFTQPVRLSFFYHNFHLPNKPVIAPGQSRVFTPLKTTTALAAGNVLRSLGGQAAPDPQRLEPLDSISSAAEIHVSIDLAVGADFRTAGKDRSSFVASMNAQHDAFKAMRNEALARLKAGQSGADLQGWLQSVAKKSVAVRSGTDFSERHFQNMQISLASDWLSELNKGDLAAFQNRVTAVTPEMLVNGAYKFHAGLR